MKKFVVMLLFAFVFSATQAVQSEAFSDVEKGAYYEDAVKWAVQEGIVSGFSDGTFKPGQTVTFNQFIKMYTNSYDFKTNGANTYEQFYNVLEQYNLVFDPYKTSGTITRGDVSVLLAQFVNVITASPRLAQWLIHGCRCSKASMRPLRPTARSIPPMPHCWWTPITPSTPVCPTPSVPSTRC